MKNHDVQTIITALGGRAALQELLGVGASAVSNYLARNELPQRAVGPVCEALRARGYRVDPARLEIIGQQLSAAERCDASGDSKCVLLIVGGGIAAYKALEVTRRLQDHNICVTGVMTRSA